MKLLALSEWVWSVLIEGLPSLFLYVRSKRGGIRVDNECNDVLNGSGIGSVYLVITLIHIGHR